MIPNAGVIQDSTKNTVVYSVVEDEEEENDGIERRITTRSCTSVVFDTTGLDLDSSLEMFVVIPS